MSSLDVNEASSVPTESGSVEPGLGDRLRRRRKALGLTLRDVAESSGLTQGFLSQIERGQANASVKALQSICAALKLDVGALFRPVDEYGRGRVQRFADAQGFSFGDGATKIKLTPSTFDHLEVLMGLFEPGGSTGVAPYTHGASEEVLLVLAGTVEVTVGQETYTLGEFDSLHYHSNEPHRVAEATGAAHARVLWTMAPPTY